MPMQALSLTAIRHYFSEVWNIFFTLIKIMLPILIIVRIITELGWLENIATAIAPLMSWVGLPGEMGLVLVTAMSSNIYAGMAVFYELNGPSMLNLAQVSVLGGMILLIHSLPIEGAIAKASGVSLTFVLVLRIGGAFLFGMLLYLGYDYFDVLKGPVPVIWQPEVSQSDWFSWTIKQIKMLIGVFFIIASLIAIIRLLRYLQIEKLLHRLLAPLLKMIGIGKQASNTIIIGFVLGLTFGGGILIQEAKSGRVSHKDIFFAMAFLSLCHSIIEDTLLILLLGADLSAVLWGRLVFTFITITLLVFTIKHSSNKVFSALYKAPKR